MATQALKLADRGVLQDKSSTWVTDAEHNEHGSGGQEHGTPRALRPDPTAGLSPWNVLWKLKFLALVLLGSAFSVSLEGYQLSMNGGIVSNRGFINQFASPDDRVIPGSTVSAWSGSLAAGTIVGQLLIHFVSDAFGRKRSFYIMWAFFAASILTESLAVTSTQWLVAKLFCGIGVGILQSTLPVYLVEWAPTQVRGIFVSSYLFWQSFGELMGSIALNEIYKARPLEYRLAIYTQWAMIGLMGIILFLIPESPWWLLEKSKTEKAVKVLQKYYGNLPNYNAHEHAETMVATIELEQLQDKAGLLEVFQGQNLRRLLIACWPKSAMYLIGYTVFTTYATYLFQYAGYSNPFLVTVILGCVKSFAAILAALLSDYFGRRPLAIYPYAVTTLSVLCMGILGCFDYKQKAMSSAILFFACLATFSLTGGVSVAYAYAGEVPQQRLRAKTVGAALAISNLFSTLFTFCTPLMIDGPYTQWGLKTGLLFGGTGIFAVAISWFILPELKHRTQAEINELFRMKVPARKFAQHVTTAQLQADEESVK